MVIIRGPVGFLMGSPNAELDRLERESQHRRRIGRSFAVANKTVTVEQYDAFLQATSGISRLSDLARQKYASTSERPMVAMTWYEAAAYCNWLSKEEGVPQEQWCYEPNASGRYAEEMKPAADFLERTGYRLPTEAEWEYVYRAGAATSRYYGETRELLPKYAWYQENSKGRSWPVGSLKPNDFGLFDMEGNVCQWCHDEFVKYRLPAGGGVVEDDGDVAVVTDKDDRADRGAGWGHPAWDCRAACRGGNVPGDSNYDLGFRVARVWAHK